MPTDAAATRLTAAAGGTLSDSEGARRPATSIRIGALPLALLAVLPPLSAAAHAPRSAENAIIQVQAEATEILWEARFPAGPEATRWRVLFDADRNGLLSPSEWGLLARGLARRLSERLELRLEGNRLPLEIVDAKVQVRGTGDGASGGFEALVLLRARELPSGLRTLDVVPTALVEPSLPVRLRFETQVGEPTSLVGGAPEGDWSVRARQGQPVRFLIEVPR